MSSHIPPGRGVERQPTAHSEGVDGSFVLFIYYSVYSSSTLLLERRTQGELEMFSVRKDHKLLTLQRPVAGYNKHPRSNPGIPIPRITVAHNGLCQNVNSVGMCYIEDVKINAKKIPQDFVQ